MGDALSHCLEAELESAEEEEEPAVAADKGLPWPDPGAVRAWWAQRQQEFHPEARYLRGRPMSLEGLREALRHGRQRERHAAALELVLRRPGQPLFETRAPAFRQHQRLVAMLSHSNVRLQPLRLPQIPSLARSPRFQLLCADNSRARHERASRVLRLGERLVVEAWTRLDGDESRLHAVHLSVAAAEQETSPIGLAEDATLLVLVGGKGW